MDWVDESDDDELREATKKYLPRTVVWTTDWTTGALIDQLSRHVFEVDPPFQRRNAWDEKKASLYIESLLLGCPVPPITLAETDGGSSAAQYVVIDGKQRLGALKRFAIDQNLKLTGLETLAELNDKRFSDVQSLPEFARFENLPIRTVVMRNWVKDEVLQFVFHRLNTQVTPLSTHELRRALLSGPFMRFLDEASAGSAGLKRILSLSEPDYRLRDAELLLRAIAFSWYLPKYRGNLKQFLDSVTRNLNLNWSPTLESDLLEQVARLDVAIGAVYSIFGDSAFQRWEGGKASGRFNRAVFDVMILTMQIDDVRLAALGKRDEVRSAFVALFDKGDFARWTSTTTKNKEAVFGRLEAWSAQLERITGARDIVVRIMAVAFES